MRLENYLTESNNPKYPRTFHLPWSETIHADDKQIKDVSFLLNRDLTITTKMDGSNVGISFHSLSTRSGEATDHPSYGLLKQRYNTIKYDIPEDMVFYGEWLYAKHSIEYDNLDDYLMVFAVLNGNTWMSYKDVVDYSSMLGLSTVPLLVSGYSAGSEAELQEYTTNLARKVIAQGQEGIVLRYSGSFTDFSKSTAKYVRKNHVQTDTHWKYQKMTVNKVK